MAGGGLFEMRPTLECALLRLVVAKIGGTISHPQLSLPLGTYLGLDYSTLWSQQNHFLFFP